MQRKPRSTDAPPERRLVAILAADVDGRTPRTQTPTDGDAARHRINRERAQLRATIQQDAGVILSFAGDVVLAEFASATQALRCALRIQGEAAERIAAAAEPVRLRIAINSGEIIAGGRHIGGAAITLAARLERIAPPGGIALPATLHDQLFHAVPVPADPLRRPPLMDEATPVPLVAIGSDTCLAWTRRTGAQRAETARIGTGGIGTGGIEPTEMSAKPAVPCGDPRASVAVVPFRAAPGLDGFANAATDNVICAFGGMATWLVVARTPAAAIQVPIDLHRVRLASGARYILHGCAETERDMLRLTVELNEAETGRVLWTDHFDHMLAEQATLRADAASRIARVVPPLLLQCELDRSALAPFGALTAHDLALHAFAAIMQPERRTFAAAAETLRQAERLPGPHASTRFAQVWWHFMAISQGWCADPAAEAREAAAVARRMDRSDPAAAAMLAFMHSVLHRDHAVAAAMLDRVIDAAPSCGLAACLKGPALSWLGDAQAAIFHAEQAGALPALGPERAWRDHVAAGAHYVAGRYADAARWARVSAMHHPGLAANARILAASLAVLGRLDEAHQAARQLLTIDPDFRISTWRERAMLSADSRDTLAQRLRLAGLPG